MTHGCHPLILIPKCQPGLGLSEVERLEHNVDLPLEEELLEGLSYLSHHLPPGMCVGRELKSELELWEPKPGTTSVTHAF